MGRFLEENETIILFAQGLVFFSLGFAVWLQRRRATRLRLTQSLIWLAAFAFVEGLAVWGYVFVPIQESYLGEGYIEVLLGLRAVLQTIAFLFLLQFGLRLLADSPRTLSALTSLGIGVWLGILIGGGVLAARNGWDVGQWERSVVALARHTLLLPGAVLGAVGLWRQQSELTEAGLPGIRPYAGAAGAALLLYGLVGGILVDHPFWSPGTAGPDIDRFSAGALQLAVVRSIVGLVLCVLAVKLLEIFEFEAKQQLEAVDRARAVAEERARFGRDLHDGTIQSLYAAGLHLESVGITAGDTTVRKQLREVVDGLNLTIAGIREYIFGLRQPDGDGALLAAGLHDVARRYATETGLDVSFRARGVGTEGPLPEEAGLHLEQVVREALSNAMRHGHATSVMVTLALAPDELDLDVIDNGVGLPDEPRREGEGLRNIHERARRMGGRATIAPERGGGTRVGLAIPLDFEAPDESEPHPQEATVEHN